MFIIATSILLPSVVTFPWQQLFFVMYVDQHSIPSHTPPTPHPHRAHARTQATLYQMGVAALAAAPLAAHVTITCPNIHFLPVLPAGIKSENDVYVATRSRVPRIPLFLAP